MLGRGSATMTLDTYGHLFADRLDEISSALSAARDTETRLNIRDVPPTANEARPESQDSVVDGAVAILLPNPGSATKGVESPISRFRRSPHL